MMKSLFFVTLLSMPLAHHASAAGLTRDKGFCAWFSNLSGEKAHYIFEMDQAQIAEGSPEDMLEEFEKNVFITGLDSPGMRAITERRHPNGLTDFEADALWESFRLDGDGLVLYTVDETNLARVIMVTFRQRQENFDFKNGQFVLGTEGTGCSPLKISPSQVKAWRGYQAGRSGL